MNATTAIALNPSASTSLELRFQSLFKEGRALAFLCDANGRVDLAALSERARNNYYRARGLVGREFAVPVLRVAAYR